MKVLFLQKDIFAKPGVMLLAAILKKEGHECDVLIEDMERDMIQQALNLKPDIIAFSITSFEAGWMNSIGTKIRSHYNGSIICGGAHPTYLSSMVIDENYLDAICIGEGEEAIVEYVEALADGTDPSNIANFIIRNKDGIIHNEVRPLIEDLDSIPFPDRSIYHCYPLYRKAHGGILYHYAVMTGRGCPYKCSYCFNEMLRNLYRDKGTFVRRRSVANVIQELKELKASKVNFIVFEDDSFTLPPREWLDEFLEQYRVSIGLPFKLQTSANLIDEDLMMRLKQANCFSLKIGIESGIEHYRRTVLNKHVSDTDIHEAARLAHKYGIRFQTFNMIGGPDETVEMAMETYRLNRRIRPTFTWCSLLHPVPGTAIYDYALGRGFIDESSYNVRSIRQSAFLEIPINVPRKAELLNLQKLMDIGVRLCLPEKMMYMLICLRFGKFYRMVFGLTFFIGAFRMNKTSFVDLLSLSFRYWAKHVLRGAGSY